MRKPRKLPADALAPFRWEIPEGYRRLWGAPAVDRPPARIDWATLFGNANPVEVEVGFGKGLFLENSARANPNLNYFGIEIIKKMEILAANRIAKAGLKNVRLCCGDAKYLLRDFIAPGSVNAVHVYFPDPWWKARHKRRTLMTPEFVQLIATTLKSGGRFDFATDVEDYYRMVLDLMTPLATFAALPPPGEHTPAHDMDYLTHFERKFRREGRPIYRASWTRT